MKGPRELQVVVVRDGEREALHNPPPKVFTRRSDVTYVHTSEDRPLPNASHYFFNCLRPDTRVLELADRALGAGASVTFVVRHVDAALAGLVQERGANLLPAYGVSHQITPPTLYRAIRAVLDGRRMVANGFIANSVNSSPSVPASGTVVRVLQQASALANASIPVTIAVLSLHRTGSNFLRDLIGLTVSGRVAMFHEHDVPADSSCHPDPSRPLFDQQLLEPDVAKARALRRAILRDLISKSARRFIFVCERDPVDRLTSYFGKRHVRELQAQFDPARQVLRDTSGIQQTFDRWLRKYVRLQRHWYRERLTGHFGLNVLDCQWADDGVLVGENEANTLIVVPTSRLDDVRRDLSRTFGSDAAAVYEMADRNANEVRGNTSLHRAFRRQIQFDPAAAAKIWQIPEVAYIHRRQSVVVAVDGPGPGPSSIARPAESARA